jgi:hypothetical protein
MGKRHRNLSPLWRPEELPTLEHGRNRYLMLSTSILFDLF